MTTREFYRYGPKGKKRWIWAIATVLFAVNLRVYWMSYSGDPFSYRFMFGFGLVTLAFVLGTQVVIWIEKPVPKRVERKTAVLFL